MVLDVAGLGGVWLALTGRVGVGCTVRGVAVRGRASPVTISFNR